MTIYHANPHGLRDQLRRRVHPGAFVDTTSVHARKRAALECHASQDGFLDATQGMNSYLRTMDDLSRDGGEDVGPVQARGRAGAAICTGASATPIAIRCATRSGADI